MIVLGSPLSNPVLGLFSAVFQFSETNVGGELFEGSKTAENNLKTAEVSEEEEEEEDSDPSSPRHEWDEDDRSSAVEEDEHVALWLDGINMIGGRCTGVDMGNGMKGGGGNRAGRFL